MQERTAGNASGWYQIEGSWNDTYEGVVRLLDWFWEHPVDFSRFSMEAGDIYTYKSLQEYPNAFTGYIPDFALWGYEQTSDALSLRNGEPFSYEGCYEADDRPPVWWIVDTELDYYEEQENLGKLETLTLDEVKTALEEEQHITFAWDNYFIKIYMGSEGTPEMFWEILEELR